MDVSEWKNTIKLVAISKSLNDFTKKPSSCGKKNLSKQNHKLLKQNYEIFALS